MTESFFNNDPKQEPSSDIPDLDSSGRSQDRGPSAERGRESLSTDDGRLAAVMAYIPFLCFVPLMTMKDNEEARFHARQGVILFVIELIAVVFLLPGVSDFIFKVVLVVAAGFAVAGIVFALQGKNYRLPFIGDLADRTKL
jgi:uncharacterized membrane protein